MIDPKMAKYDAMAKRHPYDRACRNTQDHSCICMHPVSGEWCGRPRHDPIHAESPDEPPATTAKEILARDPVQRGAEILAAAQAMADALLACRVPAGDTPEQVDAQAKAAADRWRALVGPDAQAEGTGADYPAD